MPGNKVSKQGAAVMRATIRHLRMRLSATRAELLTVRAVVRGARVYLRTGDDRELRAAMAAVGLEEPPQQREPQGSPTPIALSEGRPFEACDNYELL